MPSRLPFRFGVALPTNGPFSTPQNIYSVAEHAERLGFDSVWVNDHIHFSPERMRRSSSGVAEATGQSDPNYFESLSSLAAVAGRCERIGIGVHGLVLPIRDVGLFARQISTIHELSGRRLIISPGIGGFPMDFEVARAKFSRRGRLLDEHLEELEKVYQRPPSLRMFITGESEPAFHRVVRFADGWFTSYPTVAEYGPKIARLRELAHAAGRDPDALDTGATCFVRVDDTREAALDVIRTTAAERWGSLERALEKVAVGTADDVLQHLAARYALGLRYIELKFFARSFSELLELISRFAEQVLPSARRLDA